MMQFLPDLKRFLSEKGAIYTVRHYKYVNTEVYVEDVGLCKRTFLRRILTKDQLINYVEWSGFDSLEQWWRTIQRFIPMGGDMWIFKVEVKK